MPEYNCDKCQNADNTRMVQCDRCESWYHFECVQVDETVADRDWSCGCAQLDAPPTTTVSTTLSLYGPQASSSPTTTTTTPLGIIHDTTTTCTSLYTNTTLNYTNTGNWQNVQKGTVSVMSSADHMFGACNQQHVAQICNQQHVSTVCNQQHVSTLCNQQHTPSVRNQQHIPNACHQQYVPNTSNQHVANHQYNINNGNQQRMYNIANPSQMHTATVGGQHQMFSDASQPHLVNDVHQVFSGVNQPYTIHSNKQPICSSNCTYHNNVPSSVNAPLATNSIFNTTTVQQPCQPVHNQNLNYNTLYENQYQIGPTKSQLAARHVIPKELPHFYGDPQEWPLFLSSYENSTAMGGYSNSENLLRLQVCLKGKARDMVKSKLLVPAMVPDVIKTLQMCFGRPEFILESLIEKARKAAPVKDKLEPLIDLALCTRNICATIEACHMDVYLHNPMLVKELLDKLSNEYKMKWSMLVKCPSVPIFKAFSDWLFSFAEAASMVVPPPCTKRQGIVNTHQQITHTQQINNECVHCNESGHRIVQCQSFTNLSLEEKWNVVRACNLCRQCLNAHRRRCYSKKTCDVNGCKARHHPLLHNDAKAKYVIDKKTTSQVVNSHNAENHQQNLFRIIPIKIFGKNKSINTFAFLDEGSSVTLMDSQLFNELNLIGEKDPLCLKWTGNQTRSEDASVRVSLKVSKTSGGDCFTLRDVRTVQTLGLPSQSVDIMALRETFRHFHGLPIQGYKNATPTILIGTDNWNLAVPLKIVEGRWHDPVATKTRLGWTIQGGTTIRKQTPRLNLHICECKKEDFDLHELVKMYFQLENPVKATIMSPDDTRAIDTLNKTCIKIGNRFETGLMWRYNNVTLPDSYATAYQRLICLKNKFKKDATLKGKLQKQIDNLISKGYAEKLGKIDLNKSTQPVWYLPIFTTVNPNKPGKTRLVWDAAAKTNGVSLNDFLLCGPDLLNSLFDVLIGFRIGRTAICGDIAEMFHQIRVREEDAHVQRFLWFDDGNQPSVYVMRALSFGLNCAPCIAHFVRNKNADIFQKEYPRAVEAIQRFHYMDDFIDSADDDHQVLELANQVKMIHASGGFHIRNWVSNSPHVMQKLNENVVANQTSVTLGATEKILGVFWDPQKDVFKYEFKFARLKRDLISFDEIPTKRELLQVAMSMFDPLGFLSHHTISLKILLQDVWRSGIGWDQTLPEELSQEWQKWKTNIPNIAALEVPRCFSINLSEAKNVQLHVFVDAGQHAYAASAYLRILNDNNVSISLVAAKAKVAPLKPVSIPRLELQAALMGVNLATQICNTGKIKINDKFFWTDSTTVLKWLKMDPRAFKQFVMFRVAEILENTNVSQWKWVPSKMNPADLATKRDPKSDADIWLTGPSFLLEREEHWPFREDLGPASDNEIKASVITHHSQVISMNYRIKIEYFSCWRRLYRAVATFFLYLAKLRAKVNHENLPNQLTYELIMNAKTRLIHEAQMSEYSTEISCLKRGKLSEKSTLVALDIYLDEQQIIRAKNRAGLLISTNVIILPHGHYLTFLIVRYVHNKYHHLCQETVINEIKGKFYIPRLRVLHKSVRRKCQFCCNQSCAPRIPQMAALPKARLGAYERPFTYVGIDYFGPFHVTVGRRKEKRWGVIFTCLTVRAVHIEIAYSLDTDSCIMCLRNFISRRGMPREVYTDNGTNFTATAKIINVENKSIDYDTVFAKYDDIKWVFNPPAAPHMGGAWERLIRSIKTVLHKIQPTFNFNDETLRSALLEVEFIINSRPLTYVSVDSQDDEAITPNHILLGSAGGFKPIGYSDYNLKHRHLVAKTYADHFWHRWIKEYCPIIARRTKWFTKQQPLNIGDVVIIVDENLPRNVWPKGIIIEATKAKDDQIRRVKVKTQNGILERPVHKLAVLDVGL